MKITNELYMISDELEQPHKARIIQLAQNIDEFVQSLDDDWLEKSREVVNKLNNLQVAQLDSQGDYYSRKYQQTLSAIARKLAMDKNWIGGYKAALAFIDELKEK